MLCALVLATGVLGLAAHPNSVDSSQQQQPRKLGPLQTMFPPDLAHGLLGNESAGEPLFLTPLLRAGKLEEARAAAAVQGYADLETPKTFSGFLTVNQKFNSNLFFWFAPAQLTL